MKILKRNKTTQSGGEIGRRYTRRVYRWKVQRSRTQRLNDKEKKTHPGSNPGLATK